MTERLLYGAIILALTVLLTATLCRAQSCPCATGYAGLIQAPLIACTHEPPGRFGDFVRVLSASFDLGVAMTFEGQRWCGVQWHGDRSFTMLMMVTDRQYQVCAHELRLRAARQGVPCLPEFPYE